MSEIENKKVFMYNHFFFFFVHFLLKLSGLAHDKAKNKSILKPKYERLNDALFYQAFRSKIK